MHSSAIYPLFVWIKIFYFLFIWSLDLWLLVLCSVDTTGLGHVQSSGGVSHDLIRIDRLSFGNVWCLGRACAPLEQISVPLSMPFHPVTRGVRWPQDLPAWRIERKTLGGSKFLSPNHTQCVGPRLCAPTNHFSNHTPCIPLACMCGLGLGPTHMWEMCGWRCSTNWVQPVWAHTCGVRLVGVSVSFVLCQRRSLTPTTYDHLFRQYFSICLIFEFWWF